ncbi:hypothetical protein JQS43_00575 [Natronosporangium hydrolyticum]|uniref:Uncharacterized protein n=1 Tax=Natronosporangium hydrolyticum TaxID=2811111 RepID=A0A895YJZ1_9ACTN|nr:hypothetical protein [Natronosporangium hydrolyticum]QSB14926.1 hypothetical protein JQS43_00575 [Natronosporangium hydrolyticum]
MYRLSNQLAHRVRTAISQGDRGEFGPMAYAIMVSAMVLLALAVVLWGEGIANEFMDRVPSGGGS